MTLEQLLLSHRNNPERTKIRIGTYNIQSGRDGRLELALRAMQQMNVDLGFLTTETKLPEAICTTYSSGYHVDATEATNPQSGGGIALFYRTSPY